MQLKRIYNDTVAILISRIIPNNRVIPLHIDEAVGIIGAANSLAMEGAILHQCPDGSLLDIDVLCRNIWTESDITNRIVVGVLVVARSLCGTYVYAFSEARACLAGIVNTGILNRAVRGAVPKMHSFITDIVNLHIRYAAVIGIIQQNALLCIGKLQVSDDPIVTLNP